MENKPDFIIIGAMKCMTSSIHSQLAEQPGIFMTTPKEPNFFSDDNQYNRGIDWYENLFADAKPDDICGESSTHYTKLPDYPNCIRRMQRFLPQVKLIYVMRHPVDRLISHYIHQWSQKVFDCDINEAVDRYEELIAYSCYARQLRPYIDIYGKENILPVFFEAVRARPQTELERIARFIGYDRPVNWVEELPQQNVSNERIRKFWGYEWLVESPFMTELRRNLVPQFVRNLVKKNLTMQERPELDPAHLDRLNAVFNEDLKILGDWLQLDIACNNFKKAALMENPGWR